VRAGAALGALAPPQVWRAASRPLLRALQHGGARRPALAPEVRRQLVAGYAHDVALLERLSGQPFADWLGTTSRGQFSPEDSSLAPLGE
jgi:hypothetical protein